MTCTMMVQLSASNYDLISAIGSILGGAGAAAAALLAFFSMRRSDSATKSAQEAQEAANEAAAKSAQAMEAASNHQLRLFELGLVDQYACLSGMTAGIAVTNEGITFGILLNLWNRGGRHAIVRNAWVEFENPAQPQTTKLGFPLKQARKVTPHPTLHFAYVADDLSDDPIQHVNPHDFDNLVVMCGPLPDGKNNVVIRSSNGPAVELTISMENGLCVATSGPTRVINPGEAIRKWIEDPKATFESLGL